MARRADVWAGLAIAVLAAAFLALTFQIRETEEGIVGARFAPRAVTALLVLGGLALAVSGALRDRSEPAGAPEAAPSTLRALALPLLGLLYVAAIPLVGYLAATLPAAWLALRLLGLRSAWRGALAALVLTALSWLAFAEAMGLFLPRGRLFDLAAFLPF